MTAVFVCLLFASALGIWPVPKPIEHVTINLDYPPEQRYSQVVLDRVDKYGWEGTFGPVVEYYNDIIPPELQVIFDGISLDMDQYFPQEYCRELTGLYELVRQVGHGDDLTLGMIVGLNMMYEWTTLCTSIVAEDPKGKMFHGRNMDWSFDGLSFWNLTMFADYQRGGVTQYSGISWTGYVGLLSSLNGAFSITVDQREKYNTDGIRGNIEAVQNGATLVAFLLRDIVANNKTYGDALSTLTNAYIPAPVYLIIGGKGQDEAAVVTRNRTDAVDVWKYGQPDVRCADWYLAQTNYDHWEPDSKTDPRQTQAIAALNKMGRTNLNGDNLWTQVMQTPNVLNNGTQYTIIVGLQDNYVRAYGWQ